MNSYSPVSDMVATGFLLVVLAGLAYDLVVSWIFGRKGRAMFRRRGMWGGE